MSTWFSSLDSTAIDDAAAGASAEAYVVLASLSRLANMRHLPDTSLLNSKGGGGGGGGWLSFAPVSTLSVPRNRKAPRAVRLTVMLNDTSRCPELVSGPSAVGFFELMPA